MNLSLQEVDHLLKSLETMSSYDVARAREQIALGVTDHSHLVHVLNESDLLPLVQSVLLLLLHHMMTLFPMI